RLFPASQRSRSLMSCWRWRPSPWVRWRRRVTGAERRRSPQRQASRSRSVSRYPCDMLMTCVCDPTGAYRVNREGLGARASGCGGRSLRMNMDEREGSVSGAMAWRRGMPGMRFAPMLDLRTTATYNIFGVESEFPHAARDHTTSATAILARKLFRRGRSGRIGYCMSAADPSADGLRRHGRLPARYGAVILGSGMVFLAGALSIPWEPVTH